MKFYSYDDIKKNSSCIDVARNDLGLEVNSDGRGPATWRGGTNKTSVAFSDSGWHDFSTEESGSVIDLVAHVLFNGEIFPAQQWLGERLNLTPVNKTQPAQLGPSRYERLIEEGYAEAKRYFYTDLRGQTLRQVIRLEHPEKKKEFVQCDAEGKWSVKQVQMSLYNLLAIAASDWAILVEGEKDADTLIDLGLPATTNPGGSKKWDDALSDDLAGKDIILMPDNDPVGKAHFDVVGKSLMGKAKSIRILTISNQSKGDVTDWFANEGGTLKRLMALIKNAPLWIEPREDASALAKAKEANRKPFRNYYLEKVTEGQTTKMKKRPRTLRQMLADLDARLLGFPRRVGSSLFDHDRGTGSVEILSRPSDLFSWIGRKTDQVVDWARGDDMVTKEEFFASLHSSARRYEAVSKVPDWPRREDTYYVHGQLPDPSDGFKVFEGLIDYFSLAGAEDRIALKSLFCAPMFVRSRVPRPLWVIDSDDGAGTGKTTIAQSVAFLYASDPLQVQRSELKRSIEEITKRLISSSGRQCRVFLLDNITGDFRSEILADLITRSSITGRTPYGRGEESRPNNLTYVLTANSATLDNDLASRSFYLFVTRSKISTNWKSSLDDYIEANRLQIFSDMIAILSKGAAFDFEPQTRFPEFEQHIIAPHCPHKRAYEDLTAAMKEWRSASNMEEDLAESVRDIIQDRLREADIDPDQNILIQSQLAKEWLGGLFERHKNVVGEVRNLAKNGLLPEVNPDKEIRCQRKRGIAWAPNGGRGMILTIGGTKDRISKQAVIESVQGGLL